MPKTMEAGSGGLSSSKYPDSAKVSATRSGSFTPLKTAPTAQSKASPLSPRSASLLAAVLSWCHDTSTVMSVYSPMKGVNSHSNRCYKHAVLILIMKILSLITCHAYTNYEDPITNHCIWVRHCVT